MARCGPETEIKTRMKSQNQKPSLVNKTLAIESARRKIVFIHTVMYPTSFSNTIFIVYWTVQAIDIQYLTQQRHLMNL